MDGGGGHESPLSVQGREGRGESIVPAHLNGLQQVLVAVLLHCSGGWEAGAESRAAAWGGQARWANAFALWRALQAPGNSSRRKGLHPYPLPFSPFLKERLYLQRAVKVRFLETNLCVSEPCLN